MTILNKVPGDVVAPVSTVSSSSPVIIRDDFINGGVGETKTRSPEKASRVTAVFRPIDFYESGLDF